MTDRVAGKVVLISGGARGQGAAEAEVFVREGATVIIGDVLHEEGEITAKQLGDMCTYVPLDVTSEEQWSSVVDGIVTDHGHLDVLVNNAGVFWRGGILDTTRESFEKLNAINQTGVFLGMQAAARQMVTQRSGSIINISSIAGLKSSAGFLAYSASKWAVRGMTKTVAAELASSGVRVNSVHPGIIDTAMLQTFDEITWQRRWMWPTWCCSLAPTKVSTPPVPSSSSTAAGPRKRRSCFRRDRDRGPGRSLDCFRCWMGHAICPCVYAKDLWISFISRTR
jgi:3alpha(or 20beta)-hydroxysteroid dehydrogenase